MSALIEAQRLSHRYGDMVAVDQINFQIQSAECFGFLGPNGAGKTTTMRMIYCMSPVHAGSLQVMGKDVMRASREIKQRMGVVSQEENLDPDLTVEQNIILYGRFFGMAKSDSRSRAQELLRFMQLETKKDAKLRELSGGMKRRLMIARALVQKPELLILDEPTTGLDPQARHLIWHQLDQLRQSGVTLVLTTHYMEEAARLCDRLVIMDHGRILIEGTPADLVRKHVGFEVIEVRAEEHGLDKLIHAMERVGGELEIVKDHYYLFFKQPGQMKDVLDLVATQYYVHRPATLEDVFLKLTGRELEE